MTPAVRDLVHRPVVLVNVEDNLRKLATTLTEESIGAAVVRGPRPGGARGSTPRGIVSERDVIAALADGADPGTTTAEQIMTADIAFAEPAEALADVVERMLDNEIRHLPVIDDGVVVGMISIRDVLQVLTGATPAS